MSCVHCTHPAECARVCAVCPCRDCRQPDVAAAASVCRECVTWIGRLGAAVRSIVAQVAADRGTTHAQARADLLAAYHRNHTEVDDD